MFGIAGLLAPCPVPTFLREDFGRRARYQAGTGAKFEGLFSWEDINHLLNTTSPRGSIKLVYDKKTLEPAQLANLAHWLNEGATLVIDWLQTLDEFVYRFAQELARDVNTPVNINCYVSCPNKQGFDLHFDKHDVFIVQVEGRKQWRVFEPTLEKAPLQSMEYNLADCQPPDPEKDAPYCDCTLDVGDVLYIPRGHWHYAVAETPSIHLTVGLSPTSGIDLLNWITAELTQSEEFFRRDIPIAMAPELGGPGGLVPIADYIEEFKSRIRDIMGRDDLVDLIVHNCMLRNQLRRESKLPFIWDLEASLTPETKFSLLDTQKALIRYDEAEDCTIVYLRGSRLKLDQFPESLVRALFESAGGFSGSSIMKRSPGFSWNQVKSLLTEMYRSGVIINVDEAQPGEQELSDAGRLAG